VFHDIHVCAQRAKEVLAALVAAASEALKVLLSWLALKTVQVGGVGVYKGIGCGHECGRGASLVCNVSPFYLRRDWSGRPQRKTTPAQMTTATSSSMPGPIINRDHFSTSEDSTVFSHSTESDLITDAANPKDATETVNGGMEAEKNRSHALKRKKKKKKKNKKKKKKKLRAIERGNLWEFLFGCTFDGC